MWCLDTLRATPAQFFDCLDWLAPGFEIVQSHQALWKITAPDAVADGALHARLLVGARVSVQALARDAATLPGRARLARGRRGDYRHLDGRLADIDRPELAGAL